MAIKGSLREASLPDVLQLLAMGQKTGCLSVTDRSNFGYIYFERGRITYASIVNRRDRLGDTLVKARVISKETLDAAVESLGASHRRKRLGEILVERGALPQETLHRYIRLQIEEAVYFLFTWAQGSFNFEADIRPDDASLLVSINPESLLLEGARRVDEWSQIEKKIPSFDLIFAVDRARLASSGVQVTPEQERLLALLDGRRDVNALVDASGTGEFEVGKALFVLLSGGFVHKVGKSRPPEEVARSSRLDEHQNLGVAFYRAGMFEEATREFRRATELSANDPRARFYLALIAMREGRWTDAMSMLREAASQPGARPAVHHNLAIVYERLGQLDEARGALSEAMRRGGQDDPRVRTSIGILALRSGDVPEADRMLASARAMWGDRAPPAVWFHYAALAAALSGDTARAQALVTEGLEAYPRTPALCNTQAVLHERAGNFAAAVRSAEQGIQDDATLPQLHKNLGDVLYQLSRYEEAQEAYLQAVTLNPALGDDVYLKLGNIRFKWQHRDQALAYWERALALNPRNETVRASLELLQVLPT